MSVTINGTSGVTFNDASSQNTAATGFGFKNRIINGGMNIAQYNSTTSVSVQTTTAYSTVDRFRTYATQNSKFTVQQTPSATETGFATRVGAGFTNYLAATSSSAYSVVSSDYFLITQVIEGNNVSDLAWGTANAKTITLSFWAYSSLTGTFGGVVANPAATQAYPFTYTISSANTWTQISITVTGATAGVWPTTNAAGMYIYFGLGVGSTYSTTAGSWATGTYFSATGATSVVGTNGATFYITGVQLEKGSTATSFDYRPYTTELQLCQRYLPAFVSSSGSSTLPFIGAGATTTAQSGVFKFDVQARVPPTGVTVSSASHFTSSRPSTGNRVATAVNFASASTEACQIEVIAASGLAADVPYLLFANSASGVMLFTGCEL
jgi:hypothetical protein